MRPDDTQYAALKDEGIALLLQRRLSEARDVLSRAAALRPDDVQVLYLLGSAHGMLGDIDKAEACCRRVIALQPRHEEAHLNLGNVYFHQGRYAEAEAEYRAVIAINPAGAQAHNNLGVILKEHGRLEEAAQCLQRALSQDPSLCDAHINLGNVWVLMGRVEEGMHSLQRALQLDGSNAAARTNLAKVLLIMGRFEEARAQIAQALRLAPNLAEAHNAMGQILIDSGHLDEALACIRRALELRPGLAPAHNNMGIIFTRQGRHDEALACLREALRLQPGDAAIHSNLLFLMCYCAGYSADALLAEHRRWGDLHGVDPAHVAPHCNGRDPGRRLRLGYVSPDFQLHPVGLFIEQVLAHHDKARFEVSCYYNRVRGDEVTRRLRGYADHWHTVAGMTDAALAARIRDDGIDILVDLAGHTAGNRLLTFALKPAPVQATWMSYVATTGLKAMDYIIANRFVIPPGDERYYVEQVARLPHSFLCFTPPAAAIDVAPLPALSGGGVVFGCFNNVAKLTPETVAVWARILQALPQARLSLKAEAFSDAPPRRDFLALAARHGIGPERVSFAGHSPRNEYLAAYNRIDIGLDPFPYNGGTTSVEALWMGVPVITLRGDRFVGRMGESIMMNVGLPELVTADSESYVAAAVALATDLPRLAALRETLRPRLLASPVCNGPGFTHDLEAAYRRMWETWCRGGG